MRWHRPGIESGKTGIPIGTQQHIDRRPIFAAGNSDGDFQILEWTTTGPGPRFAVIFQHDEAKAKGWTLISMKDDGKTIFPLEKSKSME